MRTLLVNGLTVLALASLATTACSNADARPPKEPVPDSVVTKADLGRIDGVATAKVWVVEISDLQCPYCKAWHDRTFPVVRDEFVKTGKIRLAYVNFPLSQHTHSREASNAAMCASAQGKFWAMHDALFSTQEDWDRMPSAAGHFETLAAKAGVNLAAWRSCVASNLMQPLIDADMVRARKAGVQSTPSFLIGGRLVEGAVPPDEMRKAINEAIAAAK
jgi:protein-disulfide isomerase